ncbi:30S ribosomal protein S8 [Rickettsiales bacterium LUAb2]
MDNTADMLTRIRNAIKAKKDIVKVIHSKKNMDVLNVLQEEGYIESFEAVEIRPNIKEINVTLKYKNGFSSIRSLKLKSKQQRREYSSISNLPLVYNGLGISIISTSKGIISDNQARALHVGGEVICEVF